MSIEQESVLSELYFIMEEGIFDHGWIDIKSLLHEIESKSYFPAMCPDLDVAAAELVRLQERELVEARSGWHDYWRIAPQFYAGLDEWCGCVIAALVAAPGWHDLCEISRLVGETQSLVVDAVMLGPIMQRLRDKYEAAVEVGSDRIRIRLSEWLKRCQTQIPC